MLPKLSKDAGLVFFLLAVGYGYFYQDSGWNGNSRFDLTFALVQEGRLTIDSYYDQAGTETGDIAIYNGHTYSDKAIGASLVASLFYLPLYALEHLLQTHLGLATVKYLLTFLAVGLPSALAGSLMYLVARRISHTRLQALIATLGIALGTMFFPFSLVFFGHQLAASLLFGAFFLSFQLKNGTATAASWRMFLIGFLLAFAFLTEYTTAIPALFLGAYTLKVVWGKPSVDRWPSLMLSAAGALLPAVVLIFYNSLAFGSPFSIGYEHLNDEYFGQAMAQGLAGIGWPQSRVLFYLTLHPAQGLFWQSPLLLLALPGFYTLFRARSWQAEALLSAAICLYYLLLNSGYFLWWGGWSFGPRHMIPMLPFLCLPLSALPRRFTFLAAVLALISAGQMFIPAASEVLISDEMLQKIDKIGTFQYSSIYSSCFNLLSRGRFAWNLGQQLFGLKTWVSLLPVILALVVGTTALIGLKTAAPEAIIKTSDPSAG